MSDGATIRVRAHGNPNGRCVVLSHGNGFAIDGYIAFWREFLIDHNVVVFDLRNHGANPTDGGRRHHLDGMADDLEALIQYVRARHEWTPLFGIFHSVSSIATLWHAVNYPWAWDGLVLIDPPIVPAPGHRLHERGFAMEMFLASWAIKREQTFAHPDHLADQLQRAKGLGRWAGDAFNDMARATLVADNGAWRLSCPPALEATGYISNAYTPVWAGLEALRDVADRIFVVGGDPTMEGAWYPSEMGGELASHFGIRHQSVPGTGHLPQLEQPNAVAASIRGFFKSLPPRLA
ncbi:MAG: alpha/beta hydrolase [Pseudomonadota bacterium]